MLNVVGALPLGESRTKRIWGLGKRSKTNFAPQLPILRKHPAQLDHQPLSHRRSEDEARIARIRETGAARIWDVQ